MAVVLAECRWAAGESLVVVALASASAVVLALVGVVAVVLLRFVQWMVAHVHAFANLASALVAGLAVGNKGLLATMVSAFAELVMALVLVSELE